MRLLLLGTAGCHLCEQAEAIIQDCLPNEEVEMVDIAEQEQWQARYALHIPVLYDMDSGKELRWRFDQSDVLRFVGVL